jgi:hypothetical protein
MALSRSALPELLEAMRPKLVVANCTTGDSQSASGDATSVMLDLR